MSRHVTYRGITVDMESLRRENEKTPALGNMGVNSKGDKLNKGKVVKTADQVAREEHLKKMAVVNTGLKGKMEKSPETPIKKSKPKAEKTVEAPPKTKEIELPSGDIIIEDEDES